MNIEIEERVEHSLRHLSSAEANKIKTILDRLASTPTGKIKETFNARKISSTPDAKFLIRATTKLRIIFKYKDDGILIEDIVSHDALENLFSEGRP